MVTVSGIAETLGVEMLCAIHTTKIMANARMMELLSILHSFMFDSLASLLERASDIILDPRTP